jgi:hypothetical protein
MQLLQKTLSQHIWPLIINDETHFCPLTIIYSESKGNTATPVDLLTSSTSTVDTTTKQSIFLLPVRDSVG